MKLPSFPKQITKRLHNYFVAVKRFRVILILSLVALAIGYSTITSQSYLAPERDETTYSENITSLSNFQSIDYKFAEELKRSVSDVEITVDQLLPDSRTNPFTE